MPIRRPGSPSHPAATPSAASAEYADHGRKANTAEFKFTRSMIKTDPLKTAAFRITRELLTV